MSLRNSEGTDKFVQERLSVPLETKGKGIKKKF